MNEEKSYIPSLTLDPQPVAAAAAVEEAPAPAEEKAQAPAEKLALDMLSPAEQQAVRSFSEQIDVTNTEQVMNYGSGAQKNISEFSDAALNTVRTKDLGEVGDMLGDLVVELQGLNFDAQEKKGFLFVTETDPQQKETQPGFRVAGQTPPDGKDPDSGRKLSEAEALAKQLAQQKLAEQQALQKGAESYFKI